MAGIPVDKSGGYPVSYCTVIVQLCYSITLRLLDTLDSLWITIGYLWITCVYPVDKLLEPRISGVFVTCHVTDYKLLTRLYTRMLQECLGCLWISPRKTVISGIWPVDKSGWPYVRKSAGPSVRASCLLSVRPFVLSVRTRFILSVAVRVSILHVSLCICG